MDGRQSRVSLCLLRLVVCQLVALTRASESSRSDFELKILSLKKKSNGFQIR